MYLKNSLQPAQLSRWHPVRKIKNMKLMLLKPIFLLINIQSLITYLLLALLSAGRFLFVCFQFLFPESSRFISYIMLGLPSCVWPDSNYQVVQLFFLRREEPQHTLHRDSNSSLQTYFQCAIPFSEEPEEEGLLRSAHLKVLLKSCFLIENLFSHSAKSTSPQKCRITYLQLSSSIKFLQAVYSLLSVHHGSNSRTLLEEEERKLRILKTY